MLSSARSWKQPNLWEVWERELGVVAHLKPVVFLFGEYWRYKTFWGDVYWDVYWDVDWSNLQQMRTSIVFFSRLSYSFFSYWYIVMGQTQHLTWFDMIHGDFSGEHSPLKSSKCLVNIGGIQKIWKIFPRKWWYTMEFSELRVATTNSVGMMFWVWKTWYLQMGWRFHALNDHLGYSNGRFGV